jgi:thiol-disulfide isomerase/thioredoxin
MVGRNVSSSVVEKYLDDIRPTLFYTFSTWCTSCKKNYPILEMKEMRKRFRVIGIPVNDSRDRVDYFLEHNPMVFDKVVAEDYKYFQMALGFQGIPETFIIAPNKRVVYNHLGQLNVKEILNVKD